MDATGVRLDLDRYLFGDELHVRVRVGVQLDHDRCAQMRRLLLAHKNHLVGATLRVDGDGRHVDRSRLNSGRAENQRIQRSSHNAIGRRGCRWRRIAGGRRRRRCRCVRAGRTTSIEIAVQADNDRWADARFVRKHLHVLRLLLKVRPILHVNVVANHVVLGSRKVGQLVDEMRRVPMEVGGHVVAESS